MIELTCAVVASWQARVIGGFGLLASVAVHSTSEQSVPMITTSLIGRSISPSSG
jgi:hypothetical protein